MFQRSATSPNFLRFGGVALALVSLLVACGGSASVSPSGSSPTASVSVSVAPAASSAKPSLAAPSAASASAAATGSAASAIPSIPANSPVSITIGTGVPASIFTAIWIAYDQGYFKTYGLDVTLDQIEGVPQAQAVVAGDIQVGAIGGTEVLDSRVQGADLMAIQQQTESPAFYIYGDKSLKSMDDLKGKTIAITRVGSTVDMTTRVMLKNHGLSAEQDVKELAANNPAGILAALESGKVDAATLGAPNNFVADKAGFHQLASSFQDHVPMQMGLIAVRKKYADEHPDVIYAYLEAELQGTATFLNNPGIATATIAKYIKVDQAAAQQAYDVMKPVMATWGLVDPAGLKTVQEYGANSKTKQLNVSEAYDDHYVKALQAAGFLNKIGLTTGWGL